MKTSAGTNAVLGAIVELGTIAILAWVLVKGPPETSLFAAGVLSAAVTKRVGDRSRHGTGLGTTPPPPPGGSLGPGGEAPPPHDKTGFTGAPPGVFYGAACVVITALALAACVSTFEKRAMTCVDTSSTRDEYEECKRVLMREYHLSPSPKDAGQ
jgi:hypothetical protein